MARPPSRGFATQLKEQAWFAGGGFLVQPLSLKIYKKLNVS